MSSWLRIRFPYLNILYLFTLVLYLLNIDKHSLEKKTEHERTKDAKWVYRPTSCFSYISLSVEKWVMLAQRYPSRVQHFRFSLEYTLARDAQEGKAV